MVPQSSLVKKNIFNKQKGKNFLINRNKFYPELQPLKITAIRSLFLFKEELNILVSQ
jgi:hypothetical protein